MKPGFEPYDALIAIALMSAAEDPAFDTAKELLENSLSTSKDSMRYLGSLSYSQPRGRLYFISLVDDLSRRSWLIHLKGRRTIHGAIKEWIKLVEREKGQQVSKLQCDNAKDYKEFMELIRSDGIRADCTAFSRAEWNGGMIQLANHPNDQVYARA